MASGRESVVGYKYLITPTYTGGEEAEMQGGRAVCHRYCMLDIKVFRSIPLKFPHLRSLGHPTGIQNLLDLIDLILIEVRFHQWDDHIEEPPFEYE